VIDLVASSAIVTGGASGLGAATARAVAGQGAWVVIVDRNEAAGSELAASIGGAFVAADVGDEAQISAAVATAASKRPLRVLINCAGVGRAGRTLDRDSKPLPLKAFELVLRVNLFGAFNCARLAAAAMGQNEPDEDGQRGVILNTASVAAYDGQIGQVAYAASKAGIVGMTLPMARDLSSIGVRVNTIAPGLIDTPIYGAGDEAEQFKQKLAQSAVFPKRLGYPDEFAALALELVRNGFMNGETVRFDGAVRLPPR
jgi:NAD(P)-dependent dehydrogenase (short-subunit alcohol dehydrogenase family)